MKVLTHERLTPTHKLLGIWGAPVEPGTTPRCFYPEPTVLELQAKHSFACLKPDTWDLTVHRMAKLYPTESWWGVIDVADDSDLSVVWADIKAGVYAAPKPPPQPPLLTAEERAAADLAEEDAICALLNGPTARFQPGKALSTLMGFFADADRLLIVVPASRKAREAELALAYGLAWSGDRDLWLALPEHSLDATMDRLPWIDTPVRVFSHGESRPVEVLPRRKIDVLAHYREDHLKTMEHDLGERAEWVAPLLAWAASAPRISSTARPGYLGWQCDGIGVLSLRSTKEGVRIRAGVQYTKPTEDQPAPFDQVITGPISAVDAHRVIQAASRACVARLARNDKTYPEHRLQSYLTAQLLDLTWIDR